MYCAPLLLLGCLWLDQDRRRLLRSLSRKDALIAAKDRAIADKDSKIEKLAERMLTAVASINAFLFAKGAPPQ